MRATPERADGDGALQAFQDALYHRLTPGLGTDDGPSVRVVAWTSADVHGCPDMEHACEVLLEAHRRAEASIPADDRGATHSETPTLLLEVTRLERIPGTGRQWHGLIPLSLRVVQETFSDGGAKERYWLLDTLERRVLETFWRTAYDGPSA